MTQTEIDAIRTIGGDKAAILNEPFIMVDGEVVNAEKWRAMKTECAYLREQIKGHCDHIAAQPGLIAVRVQRNGFTQRELDAMVRQEQ